MATAQDHSQIQGWGADLDPANRPAVPMEHIPPRLEVPWDKPSPQPQNIEVLMSIEHNEMPPIFGTSVPPSGLSGVIRRAAFKLSENDVRHWLMLLFADRINVVEGLLDDLRQGYVPNIFAEMGWKAKFKHDRASFFKKMALMTAVAGVGVYLIARKRSDSEDDED